MSSPSEAHIVRSFDDLLKTLEKTVQEMGALAIAQVREAIESIVQNDLELAGRVMEREGTMNRLEHQINEQVVRLLALRQPVADDLRSVVTALKVASMLERVGDYASNAAKRGAGLPTSSVVPVKGPVTRMGHMATTLLNEALTAFAERDPDMARTVWEQDEEVDALHSSLFRELLTYMLEDPRSISACSHLMFIAKNIERVGDQATNIAEAAYYRATAKTLDTDSRPKSDATSTMVAPRGGASVRWPDLS